MPSDGELPPLTAAALRATRLSQAGHSAGGLSEDEVRDFIAAVAEAMETAESKRDALRTEVARLRAYYRDEGVDVDQPEDRPRFVPTDPTGRLRAHLPELVNQARRYASFAPPGSTADAEQALADAQRRAWQFAHELIFPPSGRPIQLDDAQRLLHWLEAFVYALQVQAREAYDTIPQR